MFEEFLDNLSLIILGSCLIIVVRGVVGTLQYITSPSPDEDVRIIDHSRKSLLFHENEPWKKKKMESCFDVTMGRYDGAEICELVGIYILIRLTAIIKKSDCRLYRDDGSVILRNVNGQQIDRTRKNIKIFKNVQFSIDRETNSKVVDFLDIIFSLNNGT